MLGIEKLVDLAVRVLRVGKRIGEAAADGIQYTDAFALVSSFPDIQAIAPLVRPAFAELRNLTPEELADFEARVSREANLPDDRSVLGYVRQSLALTARTYAFVDSTYDTGKALVYDWGDLLGIQSLRGDDAVES